VLDEHFIDLVIGKVGVQRGAAEGDEFGEGYFEFPVLRVGFLNMVAQGLGEIGDAALEFVHGAVEFALVGFIVSEKSIEEAGDLVGVGERKLTAFGAVLEKDGGLGVLKDGVAGGVAGFELFLDFGGQVVGSVLGLPPAAGESEFIADGAVGDDALAAGVGGELRDEGPAALLGGSVEKGLEGSFEAEFVGDLLGLSLR